MAEGGKGEEEKNAPAAASADELSRIQLRAAGKSQAYTDGCNGGLTDVEWRGERSRGGKEGRRRGGVEGRRREVEE